MHAPVSVARSMIAAAPSSHASDERVGEDQPTLGVGVEHLDRLAVADLQHVARTDRGAARHVLDQRHVRVHLVLHAELGERGHRGDHRGAARHVGLHRLHAAGGLERQAAGVEHHALAHQRERPRRAPRRACTSSSGSAASAANPARRRAHRRGAAPACCATSSTCTRTPGAAQEALRGRGHRRGRLLLRGPVHEVAGPHHRVADHRAALDRAAHRARWSRPSSVTRRSFDGLASPL